VPPDVPPAVRRSASKTIAESCWARPCPRAAVRSSFAVAVSGSGTLSCRTVRFLASDATRICSQGWLLLTLDDASMGYPGPSSRSVMPAGLRDQGTCWANGNGEANAPVRGRLPFLRVHPAGA
jgi:hypothetical protein